MEKLQKCNTVCTASREGEVGCGIIEIVKYMKDEKNYLHFLKLTLI